MDDDDNQIDRSFQKPESIATAGNSRGGVLNWGGGGVGKAISHKTIPVDTRNRQIMTHCVFVQLRVGRNFKNREQSKIIKTPSYSA